MPAQVKITHNTTSNYKSGRTTITFSVLYRIDADEEGRKELGDFHQLGIVPISNPNGKKDYTQRDAFRAEQESAYPESSFLEIEITM